MIVLSELSLQSEIWFKDSRARNRIRNGYFGLRKNRKYNIPAGHKWCSGGPKHGLVGGGVLPAVQIRKYEIPAGHKFVFGGSQTQFGRRRRTPAVQSRKYERLHKSRVEISEGKVGCFC